MSGRPVRLGLIGAGQWGRRILDTVCRLPDVAVIAVASRNPDTARLVPSDCRVERDWQAVATAEDLEAVVIATPPALHADMARNALAAGKAALIEKPLTLDLKEAQDLLDFAEKKDGIIRVDHVHLYSPAYRELKSRALAMGDIQGIRSAGGNSGPFRADTTPALWDYGAHDVAFALDLMGVPPETVEARCKETRTFDGQEGAVYALRLTFPDGAVANIKVGNGMTAKHRFLAVHFETDMLIYDDLARDKLVRSFNVGFNTCNCDDPEPEEAIPVASDPPLDCVLTDFAAAVRRGEPDLADLRLSVEIVSVLERCQAALEEG